MSKLTVEYPSGKKATFMYHEGVCFPHRVEDENSTEEEHQRIVTKMLSVKQAEIRDDDVFLATYQRSGTHWVWEMIMMLRKGSADYEKLPKESAFLEFRPQEETAALASPRVLNSHLPCKRTPQQMYKKGTKIVHVMRNPKDCFVSIFHFIQRFHGKLFETFEEFLPLMLGTYGPALFYPWCQYIKEWETFTKQHPEQIINLFYEDFKEDPVRELKKINEFLGTDRDDALLASIATACDFNNLKKADMEIKKKNEENETSEKSDKKKPPPSRVTYRKGQVGDWKNYFTVSQSEQLDQWLQENFTDCGFNFRFTI